jgi:hypothetical protein
MVCEAGEAMHNPKKELPPGAAVRVEENATIVGLEDQTNPYWHRVRFADGREAVVNIVRITWYSERAHAVCDSDDGSVTILQARLTAAGAIDLYHWLRTNLQAVQEMASQDQNSESHRDSQLDVL